MASSAAISSSYDQYIIDPSNPLVSARKGGRFNQSTILKYEDGTEWVVINNPLKERFCGFLFLQDALKESNKVKPAANKMVMHDRKIMYLSEYCGEKKLEMFEHLSEIAAISKTGFKDMAACANLREKDGKVYVFDTEPSSFEAEVLGKIKTYSGLHDVILAHLIETYDKES